MHYCCTCHGACSGVQELTNNSFSRASNLGYFPHQNCIWPSFDTEVSGSMDPRSPLAPVLGRYQWTCYTGSVHQPPKSETSVQPCYSFPPSMPRCHWFQELTTSSPPLFHTPPDNPNSAYSHKATILRPVTVFEECFSQLLKLVQGAFHWWLSSDRNPANRYYTERVISQHNNQHPKFARQEDSY
jgi:hypothetical protein